MTPAEFAMRGQWTEHDRDVAAWADFENTVAEVVREECKPSVRYEIAITRVGNAVKTKLGGIPTREQCWYIAEQVNLAYGFDFDGRPIPPTPDDVRDQEEQADVRYLREHDSHDSSRIRAAGR